MRAGSALGERLLTISILLNFASSPAVSWYDWRHVYLSCCILHSRACCQVPEVWAFRLNSHR
jgi:hypothetical protein